jgi:hypothetical protein
MADVEVYGKMLSTLPDDDDHPYRSGAWRPQNVEYDADDLRVEGELPADLYGVYLRNTENPLHPAIVRYHPFDGDGMIHKVSFRDGKVSYRNRFVRTDGLLAEQEAGQFRRVHQVIVGETCFLRGPEPELRRLDLQSAGDDHSVPASFDQGNGGGFHRQFKEICRVRPRIAFDKVHDGLARCGKQGPRTEHLGPSPDEPRSIAVENTRPSAPQPNRKENRSDMDGNQRSQAENADCQTRRIRKSLNRETKDDHQRQPQHDPETDSEEPA